MTSPETPSTAPAPASFGPNTSFATSTASSERSAAMAAVLAQNWWAVALRGVAAILFGLVALVAPGITILSLVLVFAAYMLADGVFGIVAAVRAASRHGRWGLLLLEGLADLAIGVVAAFWPGLTAAAFVVMAGAWALITGGLMLGAAFRLDAAHGRWWLVLGGIASLLFGVALVAAPLVGAVVLTWWFGGYAIAFGIFMLVLAFKLRARHTAPPAAAATPA